LVVYRNADDAKITRLRPTAATDAGGDTIVPKMTGMRRTGGVALVVPHIVEFIVANRGG
jgi:hypothetical protein